MKNRILYSVIFFVLFINSVSKGQITKIEFSQGETYSNLQIVKIDETALFAFYTLPGELYFHYLYCRKSDNGGANWGEAAFIDSVKYFPFIDSQPEFYGITLNSGKILIFYKGADEKINFRTSVNYINWSLPKTAPTIGNSLTTKYNTGFSAFQSADNSVYLCYSNNNSGKRFYAYKTSDEGETWTDLMQPAIINTSNPSVAVLGNKILIFYTELYQGKSLLGFCSSSDNGVNWKSQRMQIPVSGNMYNPSAIITPAGKLDMYFEVKKSTAFPNYFNNEIYFLTSSDFGETWGELKRVTKFSGFDGRLNLYNFNNKTFLTFLSERNDENRIKRYYRCEAKENLDITEQPYLMNFSKEYYSQTLPKLLLRVCADSENGISKVRVKYEVHGLTDSIELYDDGNHYDSTSNDNIFGRLWNNVIIGAEYKIFVSVTSNNNEYFLYKEKSTFFLPGSSEKSFRVYVNNLNLPINNLGELANVNIPDNDPLISGSGGKYENVPVLFSGGFFISGYSDGMLWMNSVFGAALNLDFIPGKVNSDVDDYRNRIYVVKSSDPHFSNSWHLWKMAVELGANFYDGDGDGQYCPRDINGNNRWDINEDRPDLLGDITAFCVYNDGLPANKRRSGSSPQKIEVHQTLFAVNKGQDEALDNTLFIRYSFINKNPFIPVMDSVLFGFVSDYDIGNHVDDYIGVDTLHQIGFAYNKLPDILWGNSTPVLASKLIQGPPAYINNVTFTDINQNGIFDEETDIPLDTAYNRFGRLLGVKKYPGAANQRIWSSVSDLTINDILFSDPNYITQTRSFLNGFSSDGKEINPCSFLRGIVVGGVDCNLVNKKIHFSGDPVNSVGWLFKAEADVKQLITTGAFRLEYNKPVDIIVAYIIGKGNSPLNSIEVVRNYSDKINNAYLSNFTNISTDLKQEESNEISDYALFNNYPNPFNPATTISYQIPVQGLVSLKVYDILGREVADLVNETQSAGKYKVVFNGSKLSSGVYFYSLNAGSFTSVKKLVILK